MEVHTPRFQSRRSPDSRSVAGGGRKHVRYDEAIDFYVNTPGFQLLQDRFVSEQNKRWVLVAPPQHLSDVSQAQDFAFGTSLLLARASNPEQAQFVGNQSGGRVFLFLYTDDFRRDFELYSARGVEFVRAPQQESYGTVAVFKDLYGNLWDLIQPAQTQF